MKCITIKDKDYVLKFTSKVISELNLKNITMTTLSKDMEEMKMNNLYYVFWQGLRFKNKNITLDDAYEIIDEYFEEDEENTTEDFFMLVLEEYSRAMGLGKNFKTIKEEMNKNKQQQVIEVQAREVE